jgi:hypothetical protein
LELRASKHRALEQLTENIIKQVTLRFLRKYYKYRHRAEEQYGEPSTEIARYDLQAVGGIIADGYYSFLKPNGKKFTATFEATSADKREEVVYKPQHKILFWDGLAAGFIFAVFLFSLNYYFKFNLLDPDEVWLRLELVLLSIALSMVVFYFIAKNFRRYRYIYAIEQFKKYYADEQWVALAFDVFGGADDKYFRELKNQCIYNGFGLVVVDKNLDPKVLITPSRYDLFLGRRRMVELLSKSKLLQSIRKSRYGTWWSTFRSQLPAFIRKDESTTRFRKSFYHQMIVTGSCAVLLLALFAKELKDSNLKMVDKQTFLTTEAKSQSNSVTEPLEYLGDSNLVFKKQKKTPKETMWKEEDKKPQTPPPDQAIADARSGSPASAEEFTSRGVEGFAIPDCSRYYTFSSSVFIVEDGVFSTLTNARERLAVLSKNGIESYPLRLSCFNKNETGYAVHLGLIFNSIEEAQGHIELLRQSKAPVLKNIDRLKIRRLDPPGK